MEHSERNSPSGWWYLLGALLAAAGVAVFVVMRISATDPDFRLVLPGSQQIELGEGDYTLFYEHTTVLNDTEYKTDQAAPPIRIFVMAPDESGVELTVPTIRQEYSFEGREGYSVVEFGLDSGGRYTVGGGYEEGTFGNFFVFALGKSTTGPLWIALIAIAGGVGVAVVLVVYVFVTRRTTGQ